MSTPAVERRRFALLSDTGRFDIAIPLDDRLGDALRAGGLPVGDGRHIVLDRDGTEIAPETPAIDLVDGGLYSVVDLRADAAVSARAERESASRRVDHGAPWWMLAVIAPLALAAIVAVSVGPGMRLLTSIVLGLAAIVTAVVWAARARAGMAGAVALLAPLALAFSAGALAPPPGLEDGVRLAVAAGFVAAAVLSAVLTATAASAELRAAAGTVAIMLAVLAAIWGLALLLHWEEPAAAAVSLGAVPLALRALPSTLVNLPEGYFIDYKHFIGNRWTVRGAIPESPGAIRVETVRAVVDGSSARLVAGAALLSIIAAVFAPVALLRPWESDPFVATGGIVLIVCVEISLLLTPRHTTGLLLRWMPRAAAAVVLVVAAQLALTTLDPLALSIIAAGLFLAAVIAAAIVVPASRGASSLAWSRTGDVIEWIAVAFALPAALLYADVLSLLRGMMAG
ncbi:MULTISPECIES: hypothetical protein [unclassified Leifsonia]|uniref:hypothetical protein n=1 Tax=unclassified Leifsonia TaxID=2663824 RepID=UPI0006F57C0D|nr:MULTISPECIES: hypothetical protein [unclassified Leifsonia]KQX05464.1 hypothetical protein ASC59_15180 [Leifsonia sp. Root1293]KRA09097.1 hypothetical protein ASD61_15175 [Leifsonia sp. Root60]